VDGGAVRVAGYVIGTGAVAFAVWLWWSGRVPAGAVRVPGTVIEEVSRRSSQVGRRTVMHAPRVAYVHPRSGVESVFEPSAFGQHRFAPGQPIDLVYDPAKDVVRLPAQSLRGPIVMLLVGVGFFVAEWADKG
jgi:hypothetical protein